MASNLGVMVDLVTLSKRIANSLDFIEGYTSYVKGKPYDYERDSFSYPRGRQFAIFCKQWHLPKPVWRKDGAAKTLVERVQRAFCCGYLR